MLNQSGRKVRTLMLTSAVVLLASVGQADADLSQSDLTAISVAVQNALAGANGQPAQVDALKGVDANFLGKFGPDDDPQVQCAIFADALADGASLQTVNLALGDMLRKCVAGGTRVAPPVGGNTIPGGPSGAGSSSCTNASCT